MTSLFDAGSSSDSDDCDYEPPADDVVSSDDEEPLPLSDSEKEIEKKTTGRQRNSITSSKMVCEASEGNTLVSNTVKEMKKADDVYKSFLDEVAAEMKDTKNESVSSGISCSESTTSSPIALNSNKNSCQSSTANTPEKLVECTEETVPKSTDNPLNSSSSCISDSKMVKSTPPTTSSTPITIKRKGLDSVLGNILNKKQKTTTLTKSLLDWKNFKKEEGIEEDLASFNRGKGGFIERKRFLERSDVRSFEIERDMRLSKRQTKRDM